MDNIYVHNDAAPAANRFNSSVCFINRLNKYAFFFCDTIILVYFAGGSNIIVLWSNEFVAFDTMSCHMTFNIQNYQNCFDIT